MVPLRSRAVPDRIARVRGHDFDGLARPGDLVYCRLSLKRQVMMTIRSSFARVERRGLAAVIAVLVLACCLTSVAPALAADAGCGMSGPSARICAPPGAADSVLAAPPQMPLVPPRPASAAWLPSTSVVPVVVPLHADPSTPRAPPVSLA